MKNTMYITLPNLLRAILVQTVQTIKEQWCLIAGNPRQKKFAVLLLIVILALAVMQIDISRQIDTDSLIRIHVLGSSNSETDQALKLKVKDAVVAYLAPQLENSQSLEESRVIIQNNMAQITHIANETLAFEGSTDTVSLEYGHFDFPIKYYGSFSLPAGNYEALRILIGEAQGRNWWCVLFPPLCFTDSNIQNSADTISGKYTDETPEQKIVIKWRGKELIEKWMNRNSPQLTINQLAGNLLYNSIF